ncbi:MAG: nuclear transport factor 2 family protein [Acidimicrobiia bacterium]|nr:nuclear transport factor 2 family protein [Acidimicrobiia bacterium]
METVRGLLASYAEAVDRRDADGLSRLFHSAVELQIGDQTTTGRPAVVDFFEDAFLADPSEKSHFVTNVRTQWLGNESVRADAYFLWTAGEENRSVIGWGTYQMYASGHDRLLLTRIVIEIRHAGAIADGWATGSGQ